MIELHPETERLVREELAHGHFQTADQLILEGIQAWREKHGSVRLKARSRGPRQNLADFLLASPFAGSELPIERQVDYPRAVDLD